MHRKLLWVSSLVLMVVLIISLVSCSSPAPTTTSAPPKTSAAPAPTSAAPAPTSAAPAPTSAAPAPTSTAAPPATFAKASLKFAAYHATGTDEAKLCETFISQVKAKTNGAVDIQFFPGGSLLTAANMFDGVNNGIADIGEGATSYNPGKFPEYDLAAAPLGIQSPWIATHVVNDAYQKFQFKDFASQHVLWLWENGPAVLMIAKKPVATLEDLKGLKIRAQSLTGDIVAALGAAPQSVPMPEMYDGLSKGVVDGVMVDPSVLISFKLGDVIKYFTDSSKAVGNAYCFYITMNKGAWDKLPKETQAVFTQVANDLIETSAKNINQENIDGIQYALKMGSKVVTLTDAEIARWKAAVASVTSNYIASITKDGKISAALMNEELKYLQDRIAYWTDQQNKLGIPYPLGK